MSKLTTYYHIYALLQDHLIFYMIIGYWQCTDKNQPAPNFY